LVDETRKEKNPSSSSKLHPLEITESAETGHCAAEEEAIHAYCIQEETNTNNVLGKRRNAVTLAWV